MLDQTVRPAGALWTLTQIGNQSEKQIPTTLAGNSVSKCSDFGRIFLRFKFGPFFPGINANVNGIITPKQLHKYGIKSPA